MFEFIKNFLKNFGKKEERYNCNFCHKLIMSASVPKICPHCKAHGGNIIKLGPKTDHPNKR